MCVHYFIIKRIMHNYIYNDVDTVDNSVNTFSNISNVML